MKIFALRYCIIPTIAFMLSAGFTSAQALNVTITGSTSVSCNSVCDGAATSLATGGTIPYTYQWVDLSIPGPISGAITSSITNLCDGNYAIVVTDGVGTVDSATVMITEPPIFSSSITNQSNVSCASYCDGAATVTPTGGTTPYTYLWLSDTLTPLSPLQTDSTATGLCALTYVVQISDANGCNSVSSVSITEPAPLTISLSSTTPAQCIVCDGTALVSASGGTPPYTYLWNDIYAQTTAQADSLCTSTYTVTATDSNSCTTTLDVIVMGPGGFYSYIDTIATITCAGSCDGESTVIGNGGSLPYTYSWIDQTLPDTIPGATNANIASLCTGLYYAVITDNNSCVSTTANFLITNPPPFLANITDSSNTTCYGDFDGTATVTLTNGIPPYNYTWSSGGSTTGSPILVNTETGLPSGTHTISITDSIGCPAIDSVTILSPPSLIAAITDSANTSCGGLCDGSATVTATGATPPFNYLWDAGNTPTDSTTNGLCAGLHTVTVTDTNGCDTVASLTITEPPVLSVLTLNSNPVLCNGECNGDATVTITGGVQPYSILWSNGDTDSTADSLCVGNYSLVIADSNNCTVQDSISITEPAPLTVGFTDSSAVCEPSCDGTAAATSAGGTSPYNYLWANGDTLVFADSLCGGTQSLTVLDANGCTAVDSVTIVADTLPITADAGLDITACSGESVTLNGSGGISYSWSPSTALSCDSCSSTEANPSITSTYTLTVSNIACIDSDQVVVSVNFCIVGPIPEIFTPNGDGTNDIFEIPSIDQFPDNQVTIFNQWGDVVFSINQYDNTANYWDGKSNEGASLPDGTYFYTLQLGDGNEPTSGYVMIHR